MLLWHRGQKGLDPISHLSLDQGRSPQGQEQGSDHSGRVQASSIQLEDSEVGKAPGSEIVTAGVVQGRIRQVQHLRTQKISSKTALVTNEFLGFCYKRST